MEFQKVYYKVISLRGRRSKGKGKGIRARQNSLSLPFQTPATQATKSFVYAFLLNARENYCTLIGGAEISQRLKAEGIVEYMIRQFHSMFRSW